MDFKERKMDFDEADRRYAELAQERDAGSLSGEEFDARRQELMVLDKQGRWWAKSARTGEWNYHDGTSWVREDPSGYQPPRASSGENVSASEPKEKPPLADLVESRNVRERGVENGGDGGDPSRRSPGRLRRVLVLAVGLLCVAVVLWGGANLLGGFFNVGPAYALVEHESGNLLVEAPSEWGEFLMVDSEGEKGRDSWSAFLGGDVEASLTAVSSLESWRTGAEGHQGMYMAASQELASYTDEELVASGPNDYYSSCEAGTPRDFSRGDYSGKLLQWGNCGGESDHVAVTLAAAPEDRECVVVLQIGGYFQGQDDEEKIQHILDTFEADCAGI